MNQQIINSIYKYIEVLYENNQRLIKVFGMDAIDNYNDGTKDILNIIQDIPRLIPYSYCEDDHKLFLEPEDGLLQYEKKIKYLRDGYKEILNNNEDCLIKIKKIRNKYEHKLHNIETPSRFTGNDDWFRYGFKIKTKKYNIESEELVKLFKDLNVLYDKLIDDILKYAYKNKDDHPFFTRLRRVDLLGFNKLYDSKLLYEIGKAIIGI